MSKGGRRRRGTKRPRRQHSHRRVSRHRPTFRRRKTRRHRGKSSMRRRTRVHRGEGTCGLTDGMSRCKRNHEQRGGLGFSALFPQPVLNAWRDVTGKILGTGYGYAGLTAPASNNPDPTHQPIDRNYEYIGGIPPDVPYINQFAGEAVAQLSTN